MLKVKQHTLRFMISEVHLHKSVTDHFDGNWHSIREQWVDGLKNSQCKYLNRTNNRVESINAKLKSVITRYSGMMQFFMI